jgi:DNA-binding response OmpR family regulator
LVLLDVRMPDRDGPETLAAIRAMAPTVPCCFISGYTGEYTEEQLMDFGASAVIRKPFQVSDLIDRLRQLTAPTGPTGARHCARTGACGRTDKGHEVRGAGKVSEYTEEQ